MACRRNFNFQDICLLAFFQWGLIQSIFFIIWKGLSSVAGLYQWPHSDILDTVHLTFHFLGNWNLSISIKNWKKKHKCHIKWFYWGAKHLTVQYIRVWFGYWFTDVTYFNIVWLCRPSNNKENPELRDSGGPHGDTAVWCHGCAHTRVWMVQRRKKVNLDTHLHYHHHITVTDTIDTCTTLHTWWSDNTWTISEYFILYYCRTLQYQITMKNR